MNNRDILTRFAGGKYIDLVDTKNESFKLFIPSLTPRDVNKLMSAMDLDDIRAKANTTQADLEKQLSDKEFKGDEMIEFMGTLDKVAYDLLNRAFDIGKDDDGNKEIIRKLDQLFSYNYDKLIGHVQDEFSNIITFTSEQEEKKAKRKFGLGVVPKEVTTEKPTPVEATE